MLESAKVESTQRLLDKEKFERDQKIIIENQMEQLKKQNGLAMQDLSKLKIEEITPLTPEIISR